MFEVTTRVVGKDVLLEDGDKVGTLRATAGWQGSAVVGDATISFTYRPAPPPPGVSGRKASSWARSLHPGAVIDMGGHDGAPLARATYEGPGGWVVVGGDGRRFGLRKVAMHWYFEVVADEQVVGRLKTKMRGLAMEQFAAPIDRHAALLLVFVAQCINQQRAASQGSDNLSFIG